MLMMNIILAVCFIPIWPILYFIVRNYEKPKKNIILGVTLPLEAHDDPETEVICAAFRKRFNQVMLPLLPLFIPPFFMSKMGASLTWFMTLLLMVIIAPMVVFAVYRGKLMALKRERNWYNEAAGLNLIDIRAAAMPPGKVAGIWFLIPFIISVIPVAGTIYVSNDWSLTMVYLTFAAMTALFWLLYYLIFRQRSEVFNEDLTLTMALTRVRRYNWSKFWLVSTWLTGITSFLMWVFSDKVTAILIVTLGYTIILIAVAIRTEFAARAAQQKLTAGDDREPYLDEDDCWLWGLLYYNPNDKHFFINDRVGINMTCNMARPAGKVVMGLALICLLAMPFMGIWFWMEEATPSRLVMTQTELIARHTSDRYTIPFSTIESVGLIDELPFILQKVSGTDFPNLYTGTFAIRGLGDSRLCLHPKDPPFLIITAGGHTYVLGDADPGQTMEVYSLLSTLRLPTRRTG